MLASIRGEHYNFLEKAVNFIERHRELQNETIVARNIPLGDKFGLFVCLFVCLFGGSFVVGLGTD